MSDQNQRMEVLKALKKARSRGVTNRALNAIGYRYGARIWELRQKGWRIKTERLSEGLYKFTLSAEGW